MSDVEVIIDDAAPDSAADRLLAVLNRLKGITARPTPASVFFQNAGYRYDREVGALCRDEESFRSFSSEGRERHILNRLVQISEETCYALLDDAFPPNANALPGSFLMSAMAAALGTHDHVWGRPGRYSSVGDLLTLDLQWYEFSRRRQDIAVPLYSYYQFSPGDAEFARPIWTNPFDFYNWKVTASPEFSDLHPFVVERPLGMPIILYFIGDSTEAFPMEPGSKIDRSVKQRILDCVPTLRSTFKADLGEAIFFADGNDIVFGAFSHYLKTSMHRERFDSVAERGLASWLNVPIVEITYS